MIEKRKLVELFRSTELRTVLGRRYPATDDLAAQIRQAIRQPLGFPSFDQFLLSGDRIVLAIHSEIPQMDLVLNPLLDELLSDGKLDASQFTLLFADRESAENFAKLGSQRNRTMGSDVHEGTSDGALALMGADDANNAVLANRLIFDADVVIPINRANEVSQASGTTMFLDFVDSATKSRWRNQRPKHGDAYGDQIFRLVGALVAIEVVIGPGDIPYDVAIGLPTATAVAANERLAEAWRIRNPEPLDPAGIVLVTVEDPRDRKSWQAVRDAVVVASRFGEQCPIVVVTGVDAPPPNELRGIFSASTVADSSTSKFDPALHSAVNGRTIHLCSALDEDVVHAVGLKAIVSVEEIQSLLTRFGHPVLLRDAHRGRSPIVDIEQSVPTGKTPRARKMSQAKRTRRRST